MRDCIPNTETAPCVAYYTPFGQWVYGTICFGLLWFVAVSVAIGVLFGVALALWPNTVPTWGVVTLVVANVLVMVVVTWLAAQVGRDYRYRKLVFRDDGVWLGGLIFGRVIPYDDIRLVTLTFPRKTVGMARHLEIQRRGKRTTRIWLRQGEAEECLGALKSLAEGAAAVGVAGDLHMPKDERFHAEAHVALASTHLRKAIIYFVLSAVVGLAWIIVSSFGFYVGGLFALTNVRAWVLLVMIPLASLGWCVSAVRHLRKSRKHAAEARRMEAAR